MGRRGKPPVPTAILKARGSWIAKTRTGEPEQDIDAPDCPTWLSDSAKEVWYQIVPQLIAMRVLSRIDGVDLARYCDAFVIWRRASEFLNTHDLVYPMKDGKGNVTGLAPYPQNGLYDSYHRILLGLEDRFGLTPSARTRIQIAKKDHQTGDLRLRQLLPNRAG